MNAGKLKTWGSVQGFNAGEKITYQESNGGDKVHFDRIKSANIGEEVYLIVETQFFQSKKININILQGKEKVIADIDKPIEVIQNGSSVQKIECTVGEFDEIKDAKNKDDFKDWAIAKITLKPNGETKLKEWEDAIEECEKALLYLLVDAHTPNAEYDKLRIVYHGHTKDEADSEHENMMNYWLDVEEKWFEMTKDEKAPWMVFAEQEYAQYKGINEENSPLKERIVEYHKTTTLGKSHFGKKSEWGHKVAWCASFVNWCFEQTEDYKKTNSSKGGSYNSLAFDWTPGNWENGEKSEAFYGAVITLKYSHTAFIVGKNSKLNKYVYLGGNQGSKVAGKQQIRYGTVTIGQEKSISKPKGYVVSEEEKQLEEMNVNADGSLATSR